MSFPINVKRKCSLGQSCPIVRSILCIARPKELVDERKKKMIDRSFHIVNDRETSFVKEISSVYIYNYISNDIYRFKTINGIPC